MSRFARIKAQARRSVHKNFSVPATYKGRELVEYPPISVRWHSRQHMVGQMEDGYAEMIDNIERLVFDRDEISAAGIILQRNDKITITEPLYQLPDGSYPTFYLDVEDETTGPVTQAWMVTREDNP